MVEPMTEFQIILCTCADREQAERIAHRLVELHLAACVNILPGVQSIYRWQGTVESAAEVLLLIKTSRASAMRCNRPSPAFTPTKFPSSSYSPSPAARSRIWLGWNRAYARPEGFLLCFKCSGAGSSSMRLLFVAFAISFCALLWVAFSVARHILQHDPGKPGGRDTSGDGAERLLESGPWKSSAYKQDSLGAWHAPRVGWNTLLAVVAATALVAISAHIAVPLGFTPVPVTMQTFAVLLLGLLFSPGPAFACLALYLMEGAVGLPVFSPHGPGGMAQLLGPSGGYLLSYPFAAALTSFLYRRGRRRFGSAGNRGRRARQPAHPCRRWGVAWDS